MAIPYGKPCPRSAINRKRLIRPYASKFLKLGGTMHECESIDLWRIGFRVRIIEPEPVQRAPALHLLPEPAIGDLHEVLVPPAAASTGKVRSGRIP